MGKGARRVTVPNHRTLVPKTLQSILRQAVITLEEFTDNLYSGLSIAGREL